MNDIEKHGTGVKKRRKLLVVDSLSQLEERYKALRDEGWMLDPDFKDPDTIPTLLQKVYPDKADGLQPAAKITLGMLMEVPVTDADRVASLKADLKTAEAIINNLRNRLAQYEQEAPA